MRLVFVSTDGVLSNQHYIDLISNRGINYMSNVQNQIDKNKISLLNLLVNKTKASVVFSGSWRLSSSLDRLNEMIAKAGATFKACDTTPYLYKSEKNRWTDYVDELDLYFNRLRNKGIHPDSFVILDDRRDFRHYNDNLIRVPYERGLRPFHIEKCLDLFGIPRKKSIGQ
jgi:hypothetical protein